MHCGDVERLIEKRENLEEQPIYYASIEDTFDIVKPAHLATGHGGRDRMVRQHYQGITGDLQIVLCGMPKETQTSYDKRCCGAANPVIRFCITWSSGPS